MQAIDGLSLARLDFLKLDCEGCEPLAVWGARDTILRARPVIYFEWAHTLDADAQSMLALPQAVRRFNFVKWVVLEVGNYSCARVHPRNFRMVPFERLREPHAATLSCPGLPRLAAPTAAVARPRSTRRGRAVVLDRHTI